jgi:hypothetical protein
VPSNSRRSCSNIRTSERIRVGAARRECALTSINSTATKLRRLIVRAFDQGPPEIVAATNTENNEEADPICASKVRVLLPHGNATRGA